jgi:hypothetical protein
MVLGIATFLFCWALIIGIAGSLGLIFGWIPALLFSVWLDMLIAAPIRARRNATFRAANSFNADAPGSTRLAAARQGPSPRDVD